MRVIKNKNIAEYQKCGQIMVACKKNKFLMSCNFCQHKFKQLPTFMRHLQLQHHDKLEFVKPAKEVEVYAVEELMNQTTTSCAPDVEDSEESNMAGDESKWLGEEDMKWLNEGVVPKGQELKETKVDPEEEDDVGLSNMSILKALEDCDVSFNLMDKLNSTTCAAEQEEEKENDLDNTLLREIQNEWEDSDTNDSIEKKIDCTDVANGSKRVLDVSNELETDITMTEAISNSTCVEESMAEVVDNLECSAGKNIKNLLEGLEDLEDVDSLLDNLEGNLVEHVSKKEIKKIGKKIICPQRKIEKSTKLNAGKPSKDSKVLINNKSSKTIKINKENPKESNKLPKILNGNKVNHFEKRLKEIEQDLEEDIDCNTKIKTKTTPENSNFAAKLKDLEDFLNDENEQDNSSNIKQNSKISQDFQEKSNKVSRDFEWQLKNLEENLNKTEINEQDTLNKPPEVMPEADNDVSLNEDLTKALADALGDDALDMLNIAAEEEEMEEEALNQDLLNLLDKELMDKEIEQELNGFKEQKQQKEQMKNVKIIKTTNKQRKITTSSTNNIKLKYQKTNLKAKNRLQETHTKNVLSSAHNLTLKENNTNQTLKTKDKPIPIKGNHEVFLQQLSINNSFRSPTKTPTNDNLNGKMFNNTRQRKTPNKENQENNTPAFNIRNIKKEKLTPVGINTDRGEKTPLKREQMFLKQSPKTQEKQELPNNNITPSRSNKTPQERNIKESPKTQEKKETMESQRTPSQQRQKTPQLRKQESIKQSPKTQEKLNKTPQNKTPKSADKQLSPKGKSPKNNLTKSNEKQSTNTLTSPTQQTNNLKTPLTTPQRLRNVSIKLTRYTPDKLNNKLTKPETKPLAANLTQTIEKRTENLIERFKLPSGISLTKIAKANSPPDNNQSKIIETPVKPTYCQQNFSESSLEPITKEQDPQKEKPNEIQTSLLPALNQTINNLKKEANTSKLRQRKASIDIVPSPNLESNNKQKQASGSKTPRHSNLDYKSYAVNRSARKKEVLQRMRHIKKQIFKSIEGAGECVTKVNRLKSPLVKQQKKRQILIENVQILPSLKKDTMTPLINPFNDFKKPFANANNNPPTSAKSVSPKNMPDDQKQAKIALKNSHTDSSINDDEKLIKKSLKRRATSPLLNEEKQTKRQLSIAAKVEEKLGEKCSELETTQLDLSESVVDFLQRDLKANRLNVDSFLNEELPVDDSSPDETSMESNAKDPKQEQNTKDKETSNNSNLIDDILEQVDNEQKTTTDKPLKEKPTNKETNLNDAETDDALDFDEPRDISLLAKFGLKIIKLPQIEDDICLEERDVMNEKANKFANIYKNWPRIWSTKCGETATIREELDISFKQLLVETNLAFKLDLSLIELKRLANLINIWYTHHFNSKLIEKRKISDSTNRYLLIFHFIPKTIKRFYYCEYCEEHFTTEHKYFTHRITHTGALFPYECPKCAVGFKTVRQLKNHESSCDLIVNKMKTKLNVNKSSQLSYEKINCVHKCLVCKEIFSSSELLYEHSKSHLKTIYNCAKCELVFASAIDVQNHMAVCNTVTKRIPKQCTPRPTKQKSEGYSKN